MPAEQTRGYDTRMCSLSQEQLCRLIHSEASKFGLANKLCLIHRSTDRHQSQQKKESGNDQSDSFLCTFAAPSGCLMVGGNVEAALLMCSI